MSNDNGKFHRDHKKLFDGILSIYFMIFDNKIEINLWASKQELKIVVKKFVNNKNSEE